MSKLNDIEARVNAAENRTDQYPILRNLQNGAIRQSFEDRRYLLGLVRDLGGFVEVYTQHNPDEKEWLDFTARTLLARLEE